MTNPKLLVLPHSERFVVARRVDPYGNPVEFGVTISYIAQAPPCFDVAHEMSDSETDTFYTTNAQEALLVYNAIMQGDK